MNCHVNQLCTMATIENKRQFNTFSALDTHIPLLVFNDDVRFYNSLSNCNCSPILIVDDEPFNLIILEGFLSKKGYQKVDKAYNGREALDKLEDNIHKKCFNHVPY